MIPRRASKERNHQARYEGGVPSLLWGRAITNLRFRIDVLDTTGSGDAFDGVFVLATLDGWEPKKAASFANVVGALTVTDSARAQHENKP